jgi:inosine-uridine nucleoside N-ribohydrolase
MRTFALLGALLALAAALSAAPVPLVFDTDMGNDIDDALALAMIHALESKGEARLIAVTITKDNPSAAAYIDAVNTFYGRPAIPVGVVRRGKTPEPSRMLTVPLERKRSDGAPAYPRDLDGASAPEAVDLLRQVLEKQPDRSVVFVQVGFSTNLARLLETAPELVRRKARLLSIMAGAFPSGKPEFNVRVDIPAARTLYERWPTDVVFSGFEIGSSIKYPAASIERDFAYADHHPIADAYRAYQKMPYDRPTWDLTSVLYGVRPDAGYFSLSPSGTVTVAGDGRTVFTPGGGRHRYLTVDDQQRAKALAAMIELASRAPQ